MKIAVNTRFLLKGGLEGVGRFTDEAFQRIVQTHPEHEFYFFFDRNYDEKYIYAKNVKPVILWPPARHPFLFYIWFEYAVARALKKYKIDLFVSPDSFIPLNTKTKTLSIIHDVAYQHFPEHIPLIQLEYYKYFVKRFLKKANRIATVSEFTKQDVINFYNIKQEKIDVVYNGTGNTFQPLSKSEKEQIKKEYSKDKNYFLYIGSLHPRKNVTRLIQAFNIFKNKTGSDFQLLLSGNPGWKTAAIQQAYNDSKYKSDIHFLGFVPDEKLPKVLGAAYALTYVSLFEGFGIPVLDALHCAVPVLTSNVSSLPEVAGEAALYSDPHSTDSIAENMIKIYSNKNLRAQLIEKGRTQRQNFSWEKTADLLYKSMMKTL